MAKFAFTAPDGMTLTLDGEQKPTETELDRLFYDHRLKWLAQNPGADEGLRAKSLAANRDLEQSFRAAPALDPDVARARQDLSDGVLGPALAGVMGGPVGRTIGKGMLAVNDLAESLGRLSAGGERVRPEGVPIAAPKAREFAAQLEVAPTVQPEGIVGRTAQMAGSFFQGLPLLSLGGAGAGALATELGLAGRAAHVLSAAGAGATLGGIGAVLNKATDAPGAGELNPLAEAARGAVTMGPLGFVPHAKSILQAIGPRAATDSAVLGLANALYESVVNGKPFDAAKTAAQIGGDVPGFMLFNGVMGAGMPWKVSTPLEALKNPKTPVAERLKAAQTVAGWAEQEQRGGGQEFLRGITPYLDPNNNPQAFVLGRARGILGQSGGIADAAAEARSAEAAKRVGAVVPTAAQDVPVIATGAPAEIVQRLNRDQRRALEEAGLTSGAVSTRENLPPGTETAREPVTVAPEEAQRLVDLSGRLPAGGRPAGTLLRWTGTAYEAKPDSTEAELAAAVQDVRGQEARQKDPVLLAKLTQMRETLDAAVRNRADHRAAAEALELMGGEPAATIPEAERHHPTPASVGAARENLKLSLVRMAEEGGDRGQEALRRLRDEGFYPNAHRIEDIRDTPRLKAMELPSVTPTAVERLAALKRQRAEFVDQVPPPGTEPAAVVKLMGQNKAAREELDRQIADWERARPGPGDTPVSETAATLSAQVELLARGERRAVMFPPESRGIPALPSGMEQTRVRYGGSGEAVVYFDPRHLTADDIRSAVANNKIGELLGYGIARKPAEGKTSVVVTVRDANGTPLRDVATDQEHAAAVLEKAKAEAKAVGGTVEVRSADAAVAERIAGGGDLSPGGRAGGSSLPTAPAELPADIWQRTKDEHAPRPSTAARKHVPEPEKTAWQQRAAEHRAAVEAALLDGRLDKKGYGERKDLQTDYGTFGSRRFNATFKGFAAAGEKVAEIGGFTLRKTPGSSVVSLHDAGTGKTQTVLDTPKNRERLLAQARTSVDADRFDSMAELLSGEEKTMGQPPVMTVKATGRKFTNIAGNALTGADNAKTRAARAWVAKELGLSADDAKAVVSDLESGKGARAKRLEDLRRLYSERVPATIQTAEDLARAFHQYGLHETDRKTPLGIEDARLLARFMEQTARNRGVSLGEVFREVARMTPEEAGRRWGPDAADAKGAVTFDPDTLAATLHLIKGADPSTAVHDYFHGLFPHLKMADVDVLWGNFKEAVGAFRGSEVQPLPAWARGVVPDVETLRKIAADMGEGVHHDAFKEWGARAFEAYLREGRAPTPSLEAVFAKLKSWLVEIYRSVKGGSLDVGMNDATRELFDRLVAGDEFQKERIARPNAPDLPRTTLKGERAGASKGAQDLAPSEVTRSRETNLLAPSKTGNKETTTSPSVTGAAGEGVGSMPGSVGGKEGEVKPGSKPPQPLFQSEEPDRTGEEFKRELLEGLDRMGMPEALRKELASWDYISKSPYSDSFYNMPGKTWDNDPPGIKRISDHWNFWSQGREHLVTDKPVANNTHWTLAQHDAETAAAGRAKWRVLMSLPMDAEARNRYWAEAERRWAARKASEAEAAAQLDADIEAGVALARVVKKEWSGSAGRGFKLVGETTYEGTVVHRTKSFVTIQTDSGETVRGKDFEFLARKTSAAESGASGVTSSAGGIKTSLDNAALSGAGSPREESVSALRTERSTESRMVSGKGNKPEVPERVNNEPAGGVKALSAEDRLLGRRPGINEATDRALYQREEMSPEERAAREELLALIQGTQNIRQFEKTKRSPDWYPENETIGFATDPTPEDAARVQAVIDKLPAPQRVLYSETAKESRARQRELAALPVEEQTKVLDAWLHGRDAVVRDANGDRQEFLFQRDEEPLAGRYRMGRDRDGRLTIEDGATGKSFTARGVDDTPENRAELRRRIAQVNAEADAKLDKAVDAVSGNDRSPAQSIEAGANAAREAAGNLPGLQSWVDEAKGVARALWNKYRHEPVWDDYKGVKGMWDAERQIAQFKASKMRKEYDKAHDAAAQEGMFNWIEAGGDEGTLREWASKTEDKKLKAGYDRALALTPAEKAAAESAKSYWDKMRQFAVDNGLWINYLQNYATHIHQTDNPVVRGIVGDYLYGQLSTRFKYAKGRVFPTAFEAEQEGYPLKTKKVGEVLAIWSENLNKVLADRAWIKNGFLAKAADGRPVFAVAQGTGRVLEPAKEWGVGYAGKPEAKAFYEKAGQTAADAERYAAQFPGMKVTERESKPPVMVKPWAKTEELADYRASGHPALRKWTYAATSPEGSPVFVETDVLVHPQYARDVENALGVSKLNEIPLVRGLTAIQSSMKQTMLSASFFHPVQIGIHALEHKTFRLDKLVEIDPENKAQRELIEHGLNIGAASALGSHEHEGLMGGGGLLSKVPVIGKGLIQPLTDWTFHEFIPRIKMTTGLHALERNLEVYKDDMASGKISRDQLVAKTASEMNAAFGELNYKMLGRNPTLQHFLRLVLLAPDFLEARGKFVAQALKPYGSEQQWALLRGAVAMFVVARVVNYFTGQDDAKRRPFSILYNGREYGLRTVQGDLLHLIESPRTFAFGRVSPLIGKSGVELATGRNQWGEPVSTGDLFNEVAKGWVPITFRTGPGRDLFDNFQQSVGIMEKKYRSAALEQARELYQRQLPRGPLPSASRDKSLLVGRLIGRSRAGENVTADVEAARKAGQLTTDDVHRIARAGSETELESLAHRLPLADVHGLLDVATDEEKQKLAPLLAQRDLAQKVSAIKETAGKASRTRDQLVGLASRVGGISKETAAAAYDRIEARWASEPMEAKYQDEIDAVASGRVPKRLEGKASAGQFNAIVLAKGRALASQSAELRAEVQAVSRQTDLSVEEKKGQIETLLRAALVSKLEREARAKGRRGPLAGYPSVPELLAEAKRGA